MSYVWLIQVLDHDVRARHGVVIPTQAARICLQQVDPTLFPALQQQTLGVPRALIRHHQNSPGAKIKIIHKVLPVGLVIGGKEVQHRETGRGQPHLHHTVAVVARRGTHT